jgi:hypothetical protein
MHLSADSALVYITKTRILDSGRLAAIFAGHDFAGLLYLQHFAGENPS